MLNVVIFALKQRVLMVILLLLMLVAGTVAFVKLNIEAYPDPVPPLVEIITQSSGQSAEEIERYITVPIEVQMAGIPHVTAIRSISLFGLSDIKIQFNYDFTYDEAVQRVINNLSQVPGLPGGAQPRSPPCSAEPSCECCRAKDSKVSLPSTIRWRYCASRSSACCAVRSGPSRKRIWRAWVCTTECTAIAGVRRSTTRRM